MPEYQVQPGDTLYDIAEKTLGDGQRWREIYQDNASTIGDDPGLIRPGQRLAIPYDQPSYQEGGDYRAPQPTSTPSQRVSPPSRGSSVTGVGPFDAAEYGSAGSIAPSGSRGTFAKPPMNYASGQTNPEYYSSISGPMAGSQTSRYPVSTAPKNQAGYSPVEDKLAIARRQQAGAYQRDQAVDMSSPYDPSRFNAPNQRPFTQAEQQGMRQESAGPALWNQMNTQVYPPGSRGSLEANRGQPLIDTTLAMGNARRNQAAPSAMQNPDYPYGPNAGRGVARPVAPQDSEVHWPAPPGVMQQSMPETVTPRSYGGRFTDRQGNLVAPNAYRGYMGQQPQPVNPYPPEPEPAPRRVIVEMADGTTMIYDASTNQWETVRAPQGARPPGPADPFQQGRPLAGQMRQAGPIQQTTRVWNTARQNWPR